MSEEKTRGELLKKELFLERKHAGEQFSEKQMELADQFFEDYKTFLDESKTEREAVASAVAILEKEGYTPFDPSRKYEAGEKLYYNNRGKALIFATMGRKPLAEGVKILVSHIDSPRLDLKPNPLYEDKEIALFKTHYYGGIKKYQWTAIPLALHGVIALKNGETIIVKIGDNEEEPVFCVTDLLPHLSKDQNSRPLKDGIKGEELNVLVGSLPFKDDKVSQKVKLNILNLLHEKYGIVEEDFLSADLTMVPSFRARDIGFDRSMIGAYGHDDKVCAYTSMRAALEVQDPAYTVVTVFADREEIGSMGNTGLNSDFVRFFIEDLAAPHGIAGRTVLSRSKCLSADVNAAFDPTFPDAVEKNNIAYMNHGVVITKYTGAGGKSGTSEAPAEFMAEVRKALDDAGVVWQTGELGKVDQGGGGTVAQYVAHMNVEVVDVGVPMLSMHAPFELVAKTDVYETYRAFLAYISL